MSDAATRFAAGDGSGSDWGQALARCVEKLAPGLARLQVGADEERLGLVFATDAAAGNLADIESQLREATGVAHWTGTLGIGVCASGVEYFDQPAVVVLIASLPRGSFAVFDVANGESTPRLGADHRWRDGDAGAFGLVHADPHTPALPERLAALAAHLSTGFVVGGLTSSRGAHELVANGPTSGGIGGVLLDAGVAVGTRLSQGCSPIGPRRRVTRCQENLLLTLDERPALDVFGEDIGEELAQDMRRVGGLIFAALPVPGSDTGDYLVRNLVGLDPNSGALAIAEQVSEGDSIVFCRRDKASAEQDLRRMLTEVRKHLPGPPAAAVYYSCLARGPSLFGSDSEELGIIREALGDLPLVGFFGNGEISHDRLYAYTGVLTLFG